MADHRRKPSSSQKQVSLGQAAHITQPKATKKRKVNRTRVIVASVLTLAIVAMLAYLIVTAVDLYRRYIVEKESGVSVQLTSHSETPAALQDKVAYYVLGLFGEEETDPTDSLAVLCYDKNRGTLQVLQLPQATYIGASETLAAAYFCDIWAHPQPLDWCTTCRRQVPAEEIGDDGRHTVCGTTVTQMNGSSSQDLLHAVNDMLGLPVDAYFLLPQEALVKLVNLVSGIDVELEEPMTVGEINFPAGVQTLDGESALYYANHTDGSVDGDIARLVRQRKVWLALFQRLTRESKDEMTSDPIGPLMYGSTPIHSNYTRDQIIGLLDSMRGLQPASMTVRVLPGQAGTVDGRAAFTTHKDTLVSLLNASFNPYGAPLTAEDVGLPEQGADREAQIHEQVLSDIAVAQSGGVTTTAATTATAPAEAA